MSGWDASSRPTWDPQDGPEENTQSFGVPDSWYSSQEPAREASFPSSDTPGAPPDIFLQDYDASDYPASDFGDRDFPARDFPARDFDVRREDNGRPGNGRPGNERPGNANGRQGTGRHGGGLRGTGPIGTGPQGTGPQGTAPQGTAPHGTAPQGTGPQSNGSRPQGNGPQSNGTQNNGRHGNGRHGNGRHGGGLRGDSPRGNGHQGNGHQEWDYPQRDYPDQRDFPGQDYAPRPPSRENHRPSPRIDRPEQRVDPLGRGQAEPGAYGEPEQAARMDPALRDFFAPHPERRNVGQSRDPWAAAPDTRDPRRDQVGNGRGPRQPGTTFEDSRPGGWDSPAPRPGSRSAHRQDTSTGSSGRTALVAIAAVVVVGIAVGAYILVSRGHSSPPSAGPTTHPTSSPTPAKSTAPAPPPKTVAYTLTTPAKAGGYPKLTTTPSAVQTAAGAVSQAIENAVKQGGGKVTGQVTAGYQLSSGQVLAFTGFKGTFTPAKVMASLATLGTGAHPGAAGPHGGMLACATAPGSPSGTVCVWVTTTTLGVTEFFSPTGPEVVTDQAKAAADTLKFRNGVEVAKS